MVGWKAGISLNLASHNCNGFSGEKVWIAKPLRPNLNISKNQKITQLKMLSSKEDSNYVISTSAKDISADIVDKLLPDALVWASLHGLLVGDKTHPQSGKVPGVGLIHAPFSLLPTSFSEIYWNQACELVPLFNDVVDRVSSDGAFLQETLSRTKEFDDFTARLLNIHSTILDENIEQNVRLGIHRSDYMVDTKSRKLLQIEFNTISASFSGLGSLVSELHRHLIDSSGETNLESKCIPKNFGIQKTAEALALTWKEFNDRNSVILVVILPEEHNMYDQHWICMELKRSYGVSTIRKTLSEINAEVKLSSDRTLYIGGKSVAVVYYRAGYAPEHYPSEEEWKARLTLELSSAVKCPSISYHLSGTKKVQQELAKDGVLERFVDDKEAIVKLRNCFAGLWGLDGAKSIIQDAIREPDLFVLKPQREGGGNNIYGNDIREKLLEIERKGSGHAAYILMQRIFPPTQKSYLVRNGVYQHIDTVSELGIYGVYLRNKDKVIRNEQGGYLMRTKVSTSNEGGVAAGFAVVDSLYID